LIRPAAISPSLPKVQDHHLNDGFSPAFPKG
jgi:hypothetical protein